MLTRKQHELLIFIDRHLRTTGFSPSFEEMKDALKLKSKSGIHRLITALEERGFLHRRAHRARALEVLRLPENLASLPAASHVAVGQKAAAVGDYPLAVRALKQVAQLTPEDPLAPRACVILARLYGERLGDEASALKLYRHVAGRYPGTDAARFAQSRLKPA